MQLNTSCMFASYRISVCQQFTSFELRLTCMRRGDRSFSSFKKGNKKKLCTSVCGLCCNLSFIVWHTVLSVSLECVLRVLWGVAVCLGLLLRPDTKLALCVFSLKACLEQLVMRHIFTCVPSLWPVYSLLTLFLVLLPCKVKKLFHEAENLKVDFHFLRISASNKRHRGRMPVLVIRTTTAQSLKIWGPRAFRRSRCCATLQPVRLCFFLNAWQEVSQCHSCFCSSNRDHVPL